MSRAVVSLISRMGYGESRAEGVSVFGIWVEPLGAAASTDEPGFLTNCGRDLSFETEEHARHEMEQIRDEMRGVRLSVRSKSPERMRAILVKNKARLYRDEPRHLNKIEWALQYQRPVVILAAIRRAIARGESPAGVNMVGAEIYARWLRRFGERADDAAIDADAERALVAVAAE